MPWQTHVAVIICQCVYSTWVKTDWKNIAWLKNGSSLKSCYYLWTTRYLPTIALISIYHSESCKVIVLNPRLLEWVLWPALTTYMTWPGEKLSDTFVELNCPKAWKFNLGSSVHKISSQNFYFAHGRGAALLGEEWPLSSTVLVGTNLSRWIIG